MRPATAALSLDEAVSRASRSQEVEGIILLGSTAFGSITPASDFDVMVVLSEKEGGFHAEVTVIDGRLADVLVIGLHDLIEASRIKSELCGRIVDWLVTGQIVFDRSGVVVDAQRDAKATGSSRLVSADTQHAERWQVSYDLLVNERYLRSDEHIYRLALRLRALHSFSRLILAYFRVRGLNWLGEKWAIRYLTENDADFLRLVMAWLDEGDSDSEEKVRLHRRVAESALGPVGGVWPPEMFPLGPGVWERVTG